VHATPNVATGSAIAVDVRPRVPPKSPEFTGPPGTTRAADLRVDQRVRVSVEHGRVIVAPLPEREMVLDARP